MKFEFSIEDVSQKVAHSAFRNTSHYPEKRGDRVRQDYVNEMQALYDEFSQYVTEDNEADIEASLNWYKETYLRLLKNWLYSHANLASSFIVGPSKFPVQKMEKRNRWCDNHMQKLLDFEKKGIAILRKMYDPEKIANAPIRSDDNDAIAKLRAKLAGQEKYHASVKAANKIVRNSKMTDEEKIAKLNETGHEGYKLMAGDFMNRKGYPSYVLSNSNQRMQATKNRIAQLERESQAKDTETTIKGVEVIEDTTDARIRLIFPGKPSEEVRSLLKRNGFKWSPTNTAWQRMLNANGRTAAHYVLSQIEEQ